MKIITEEQGIQDSIVKALSALGFVVSHTNTHGVRGKTGVSKGIPDLLVYHKAFPPGVSIGLEVKKPKGWKWSSYEQYLAWKERRTFVVFSVADALDCLMPFAVNREGDTPSELMSDLLSKCQGMRKQLKAYDHDPIETKKVPEVATAKIYRLPTGGKR